MVSFASDNKDLPRQPPSHPEGHVPVLLREVVEALALRPGAIIVDGTVGLGGHSEVIAEKIAPHGTLIAIDRDKSSLEKATRRLAGARSKVIFVHRDFRYIDEILKAHQIEAVEGILLDLGISSYQLGDARRGFSLNLDGPLDMRMDQEGFISAYDLINTLSEDEISRILKFYGEERYAGRIARMLVRERGKHPIRSTRELTETVLKAVPGHAHRQKIHPATRTFQAFRIAVNRELESLETFLKKAVSFLRPGGRLVVISFHSLEDRIVKQKFREFAARGEVTLVEKKPLRPQEDEVRGNPRARSARMRVAEKARVA